MAAAVRWRAGHARPLPGGEKGKVSGRGKVLRRGQDPSLRREDPMAAAVRWRAGHARPLPGGAKGKLSGRGKVRRRGQDPSLRREDSMAAAVRWRAGHARPLPGGAKGKVSGRGNGGKGARRQSGSSSNKKGRCIATASFLLYSNLRMAKITWTFLRPGGPAGPRHPACTARRGRGRTCRSRGGSCRGLPPTAGGHGRGGCSRQSRSHGRRAGFQ